MNEATQVETRKDGAVLVITLNGPKSRNAVGRDVYGALRDAVVDAGNSDDVRASVLKGAGGFFSHLF